MSTKFETFRIELLLTELNPPESLDRLFSLLFFGWEEEEWLLVWDTMVLLWFSCCCLRKEFWLEKRVDFSTGLIWSSWVINTSIPLYYLEEAILWLPLLSPSKLSSTGGSWVSCLMIDWAKIWEDFLTSNDYRSGYCWLLRVLKA